MRTSTHLIPKSEPVGASPIHTGVGRLITFLAHEGFAGDVSKYVMPKQRTLLVCRSEESRNECFHGRPFHWIKLQSVEVHGFHIFQTPLRGL